MCHHLFVIMSCILITVEHSNNSHNSLALVQWLHFRFLWRDSNPVENLLSLWHWTKHGNRVIFCCEGIGHLSYRIVVILSCTRLFKATLTFSTNNSILKSCAKWALFSEPVTYYVSFLFVRYFTCIEHDMLILM